MTLEFNKVVEQVQTMGRYLGHVNQSLANRLELALERFYACDDLEAVHERIKLVRESSVSGYRGAAPAPKPYDELICGVGGLPTPPQSATLVAVDGSQIYPDPHAPAQYYLINIGVFAYYYGEPRLPQQATVPELYYSEAMMQDRDGRLITNQTVNARRSVMEMQFLAKEAWKRREEPRPLIGFHDGGLLKFFGNEVAGSQQIEKDYMDALRMLSDSNAMVLGYLDKPRSTYLISLLHLMSLDPGQVNDANLRSNGEIEGLTDDMLYAQVLQPGERSAIMTQNSPQNLTYKDKDAEFEVAFFYVNVSNGTSPVIVRIDVPMWVARDKEAVAAIQSLIVAQCRIQGRKSYPYALTRADELAYVSSIEKSQLDEMIRVEMMRNQLTPEASNKLQSKGLARSEKRQHRLGV
ncbi:MAG TPA: DNA double-strand break repair nuclease NurA [Phototrophicaceae bacterium]|nr:DNA double-strand break repair nuclease NurA [Phototrophicaceae bacterium]